MDIINNLDFSGACSLLLPQLFDAFWIVVEVTITSFIVAMFLGIAIAFGRISNIKIVNAMMLFLIEIVRGTPLLVQLVYTYYVIPLLINIVISFTGGYADFKMTPFMAGVIGLGIHYAVLLSEVIRSAIANIDSGQREAALSLGFGEFECLCSVILPQAMRNSVPVFGNYLVTIVKDTSLLAYISLPELLLKTKEVTSQTFLTIESYTILAVIYLLITFPLSRIISLIEKKIMKI